MKSKTYFQPDFTFKFLMFAVITVILLDYQIISYSESSKSASKAKPITVVSSKTNTSKPVNTNPANTSSYSYALNAQQQEKLKALMQVSPKLLPLPIPKYNNNDGFVISQLPLSTQHIQQNQNVMPTSVVNPTSERCIYNNEPFVLGDMINTEQGWLRCSPTFFFTETNPTSENAGNAAWIKVQ